MIRTFCDICGNELKTGEDYWRISLFNGYVHQSDSLNEMACGFCKNSILNFIQEMKKREQHEDS